MTDRKPMIAGNWKMNLSLGESERLISQIKDGITNLEGVGVLVSPPFTSLPDVKRALGESEIRLAGQRAPVSPRPLGWLPPVMAGKGVKWDCPKGNPLVLHKCEGQG